MNILGFWGHFSCEISFVYCLCWASKREELKLLSYLQNEQENNIFTIFYSKFYFLILGKSYQRKTI